MEDNLEPLVGLEGSFSVFDVSEKYHNALLSTAHIHKYKKEKLDKAAFLSQSMSVQQAIYEVREYFKKKNKKHAFSEEKEIAQGNELPHCDKLFTLQTRLSNIVFPSDIQKIVDEIDIWLNFDPVVSDVLKLNNNSYRPIKERVERFDDLIEYLKSGLEVENDNKNPNNCSSLLPINPHKFLIVQAPPGCGKTHSITLQIESLISQFENIYDARKILVLSFTRNAVQELKNRLQKLADISNSANLDLVRVMTFDSLAYQVLLESSDFLPSTDFDSNITKLKAMLISGSVHDNEILNSIRWVFIDEYQDLVGCRADLVIEFVKLVKGRSGAVNLLGDPCQSIMNFQLHQSSSKTSNEDFVKNFKELAGNNLELKKLTKSYRFKTMELKDRVELLRQKILGKESVSVEKLAKELKLSEITENSALLFSRNIDCFLAKSALDELGVGSDINQGAERIEAPDWVFEVFNDWKQPTIAKNTFIQRCKAKSLLDYEEKWSQLNKLSKCKNDQLNVVNLVWKIEETGWCPPDLDNTKVVISTVHKAKGLQFPNVIYLAEYDEYVSNSESLSELYVAFTRAQNNFSLLNRNELPRLQKKNKNGLYFLNGKYYLEGIREIDLKSFFPQAEDLNDREYRFLLSKDSKFSFKYEDGKVFVVSELPSGKQIKIYRLPRLEKCKEFKSDKYVQQIVAPSHFATFVYGGESPRLENILGPTCFIKVPVFEGFWNAKYL